MHAPMVVSGTLHTGWAVSRVGNGEAIDLDGIYGRFFSEARAETVLPPGFYIFGAASSAQEFDALVEDLRRQLVRYG